MATFEGHGISFIENLNSVIQEVESEMTKFQIDQIKNEELFDNLEEYFDRQQQLESLLTQVIDILKTGLYAINKRMASFTISYTINMTNIYIRHAMVIKIKERLDELLDRNQIFMSVTALKGVKFLKTQEDDYIIKIVNVINTLSRELAEVRMIKSALDVYWKTILKRREALRKCIQILEEELKEYRKQGNGLKNSIQNIIRDNVKLIQRINEIKVTYSKLSETADKEFSLTVFLSIFGDKLILDGDTINHILSKRLQQDKDRNARLKMQQHIEKQLLTFKEHYWDGMLLDGYGRKYRNNFESIKPPYINGNEDMLHLNYTDQALNTVLFKEVHDKVISFMKELSLNLRTNQFLRENPDIGVTLLPVISSGLEIDCPPESLASVIETCVPKQYGVPNFAHICLEQIDCDNFDDCAISFEKEDSSFLSFECQDEDDVVFSDNEDVASLLSSNDEHNHSALSSDDQSEGIKYSLHNHQLLSSSEMDNGVMMTIPRNEIFSTESSSESEIDYETGDRKRVHVSRRKSISETHQTSHSVSEGVENVTVSELEDKIGFVKKTEKRGRAKLQKEKSTKETKWVNRSKQQQQKKKKNKKR